jgi:hypothetical protein
MEKNNREGESVGVVIILNRLDREGFTEKSS